MALMSLLVSVVCDILANNAENWNLNLEDEIVNDIVVSRCNLRSGGS